MTDPAFDPIFTLAAQAYPGAPNGPAAVVRELLLVAVGNDAERSAAMSARKKAYFDAMIVAQTHLGTAMRELSNMLFANAAIIESEQRALTEESR